MEMPKLPVMVRSGMAEKNSTLRSARPVPSNRDTSASTVRWIHCCCHHAVRFGRNDGCTSARYRRCRAPSMNRMLASIMSSPIGSPATNVSPSRNTASHVAKSKHETCLRSG